MKNWGFVFDSLCICPPLQLHRLRTGAGPLRLRQRFTQVVYDREIFHQDAQLYQRRHHFPLSGHGPRQRRPRMAHQFRPLGPLPLPRRSISGYYLWRQLDLQHSIIYLYTWYNRRFPPDGHRQSIPTQARQSTGAIYYGLRGTPRGRQFLLGRNAPAFSHQAQADVCYDDSGRYPLHRLCASKIPFFLPSFQSIGSRRTNRLSPPLIRAALSSSLSGSCTFKRTARPSSTSWMKWTRRLVLRRTIAPSIYIYALRQFSRPTLSTF